MSSPHQPSADELAMLRESVRDALRTRSDWPVADGGPDAWSPQWDLLAQQGVWSAIEPPEGSLTAAAVIAEELGRALFPGPGPEALAGAYVNHHLEDGHDAATSVGPAAIIVSGAVSITRAPDPVGRGELHPTVAVGPHTVLIVPTGTRQLALAPAGSADLQPAASLGGGRQVVTPRLSGTRLSIVDAPDPRLGEYGLAARTLLYCADTLGCVDYALQRAVDYAQTRTTFGVPIGKYQAVAHRLVDHAITAAQMRILLGTAVAAFDARAEELDRHVATAETFFAGRGATLISDCVQLVGAIGFTWEFGLHFYLRRVVDNAALARGPRRPQQRLAEASSW